MKVTGIIVSRRSMGKNLAFANVRPLTMTPTDDEADDGENDVEDPGLRGKDTVARGGGRSRDDYVTPEGNRDGGREEIRGDVGGDGDGTVLRVAFRRASPSWDEVGSTSTARGGFLHDGGGGRAPPLPFPVKASSLPHGAIVSLELRRRRRPRPKLPVLGDEIGAILRPSPSPTAGGINEKGPSLEVRRWTIIEHPAETARRAAMIGFNGRNVGGDGDGDVGECWLPSQTDEDERGRRGISCSAYLRARGDAFTRLNRHPHQRRRSRDDGNGDRSELPGGEARLSAQMRGRRSGSESECGGSGGHGDRRAKSLRARVFASWILETFGHEYLRRTDAEDPVGDAPDGDGEWTGCTVLDVAGGRGQLSVELSVLGRVPCAVVDPLVRGRRVNDFSEESGGGDCRLLHVPKRERKRMCRACGPPPRHLVTPFDGAALQRDDRGDASLSDRESSQLAGLVAGARCLVGLHPDEATEDILDVALRLGNVSVAIVPCCVFPGMFPMRRTRSGKPVQTYEEFMEYLLDKDHRLRRETLPFDGKNQVIYYKCTP